jgi:hypothetical protein
MEVTAGEPVREECLKGRLNRFGVFAVDRPREPDAPTMRITTEWTMQASGRRCSRVLFQPNMPKDASVSHRGLLRGQRRAAPKPNHFQILEATMGRLGAHDLRNKIIRAE